MLSVLFLTWKNPATDLVTLQNRLTDGGAMQSSCLCDFDTWVLRWPGYHGECFLNSHVMVPKFGCWNIMVLECRWTIKVLLPSTYLLTWEMRMLLGSEEPAMWGCAVWSTEWSQCWKSAAAHKPWWEKRLQQLLHATKPGCLKTCDTEILSHLSFNSPVIFRRHWSKEPCSSCCIFLAQSTTVLRDTWISRFEGQDGQFWRTLDR